MSDICLHIGSGPKRKEGYVNVDALPWDGATDILVDVAKEPIPLPNESVTSILSCEFLEHISWRRTHFVIAEMHRLLKTGGTVEVQVPDCGSMMQAYVKGQICDCVPHKVVDGKQAADPNCSFCKGRAVVNTERWRLAFLGAQKHAFDAHLNIFTGESLLQAFEAFDWQECRLIPQALPWKIVLKAKK